MKPNSHLPSVLKIQSIGFYPVGKKILPDIINGKRVLIVAHGNSLRALVKYLDKISNDDILKLNIPTGVPLIYELDKDLAPLKHYYLGDQGEIEKKSSEVAAQGKLNRLFIYSV